MIAARIIACFGLVAVACGEDLSTAPVNVGGFPVDPLDGGITAMDELLVVHPKALVGVGFDSNVISATITGADVYSRLLAGATGLMRIDEQSKATADIELEKLFYHRFADHDLTGGSATVAYQERGLVGKIDAQAQALRQETPQVETGELLKNQTYSGSLAGDYRALYSSYGAELSVSRVAYLEDSRLFTAAQGSHDDYQAGVRAGWDYARDARIFLHLIGTRTVYRDDSLYDDSYGGALRLGWEGPLGERATARLEAGVGYRRFQDAEIKIAPYNRQDAYAPSLAGVMTWPWTEGGSLEVTASSAIGDGVTSDAAWIMQWTSRIRQQVARSITLVVLGDVSQDRNLGAPPGGPQEVRTVYAVGCGCEYQVMRGLAMRLSVNYLNSHSNSAGSFDRFQALMELATAY